MELVFLMLELWVVTDRENVEFLLAAQVFNNLPFYVVISAAARFALCKLLISTWEPASSTFNKACGAARFRR